MSRLREVLHPRTRHEVARREHPRQVERVRLRLLPEDFVFKTISEATHENLFDESDSECGREIEELACSKEYGAISLTLFSKSFVL